MANDKVNITQSTAPDAYLDAESVVFGTTTVLRERVQLAGAASGEIAVVSSAAPATNTIGVAVRVVPSNSSGELKVTVADTLTVAAHAVTNAGTFLMQENGSALTALQLIDDPVKTDDAAFTPTTDKIMMAGFEFDDVAPDSVDEGDAGAARMSANRNQYVQLRDAAGNERGANVNSSNELKVTVADTLTVAAHAVTNAGTFLVQENGGSLTALQIIDDWDESDRAKVNLIASQAGITGASGNVAANTPRVTLAGDDRAVTALEILDNAISGSEMQVDVVAALPAGDNNIGNFDIVTVPADPFGTIADAVVAAGATGTISAKLRAISRDLTANVVLAAGNNNVGDVDVASIAAGDNNIGNVDIVTVPSDPFGTIADSVVAAGATGTISAKLRAISRDLVANVVLAAGTNNVGDVDVASIAAGNNNIGDVDVASIAAGDNNIGNVDIVTVPADPFGTIADAVVAAGATGTISAKLRAISRDLTANVVLAAGANAIGKLAANDGVDIGDVTITNSTLNVGGSVALTSGAAHIGSVGAELESNSMRLSGTTAAPLFAAFTATASGNVTVITSATTKIRVLAYTLVTNSAFALQWKDSTDSTLSGVMPFAANGGVHAGFAPVGHFQTATGTALVLAGATATGITGGHITYLRV